MPDRLSNPEIRILVVDDHPVFRAGLANLLASERDFTIVGKAANGTDAIDQLGRSRPHVVLLDLSMPGIGGFETLRRIQAVDAGVRVVVLTSSDSPDDVGRAVRAGAHGYLTKLADHAEIVAAIRDVHAGKRRLQHGLAVADPAPVAGPLGLSPREIEVLTFLRNGYSNAEIGRTLGITERTVKAHVAALLEKLHAADRAEAVARGFDLGILKAATPPA
jgi:DNA-binding NarL/FixJ family response regulator